uniref:Uncharacterized protein n=1 Tax=Pithovirus LCPAC401 TaxID=2506595 RepID=A0A481ZAC6_9VIRU|nr:MAG: hypothetical protein LCPAC401_00630 [Pithovirus LCPAC401]
MSESIQALIKYKHRLIHLLTPDLKDHLNKLKKFKDDNFQEYSRLMQNYHRPIDIQPGTVSAFLFGCLQQFYGNIDSRCTCLCLQDTCTKQIWTVSGNKLQKSNDVTSEEAYLFIPNNFTFTKRYERILMKGGVRTVSLIKTVFSKHIIVETVTLVETDDEDEEIEPIKSTESTIIYLIILLIIILIIAFCYFWWRF